jgi:acid phosphatase family membrane protein YuiD
MAVEAPPSPEDFEAIKAAYEQARASIEAATIQAKAAVEAGQMQADAARYAADLAAVVARSVGHDTVVVTALAAFAVIVAAGIQAWSIRDQSAKQAQSLREQSKAQANALHAQSLHQAQMVKEEEGRHQKRVGVTAATVIVSELSGHLKFMKQWYAQMIVCQHADRDLCLLRKNCKISSVGGEPVFYLQDFVRDLAATQDPETVGETLRIYNLFSALSQANLNLYESHNAVLRAQAKGELAQIASEIDLVKMGSAIDYLKKALVPFVQDADALIDQLCELTDVPRPDTGETPVLKPCWEQAT